MQLLSGSTTPTESMPVWLRCVMLAVSPTPHFVASLVEKQIADIAVEKKFSKRDTAMDLLREKQPSRTFVTLEQLGGTVAFLCSPAADQITGAALAVDGGWTAQ
jgi:NAD(P)-dependent dehydrogenase (short-subunit alcohol dehydrogenase family)